MTATNKLEPIYKSLFNFNCIGSDYENLNKKCFKITKKYFYFNVNENEGEIIPLNLINKLIENTTILNIAIELRNKEDNIIQILYLEDTFLLKIKNILDFDYQSNDIMKIKVKYKYKNMKIFKDELLVKRYQRKQK